MSKGFDKPLYIKINYSLTLVAIWAVAHAGAGLLLAWVLPWRWGAPALLLLGLAAWLDWRRPWPGREVVGLWWLPEGACRLEWADGARPRLALRAARPGPLWVSLEFAPPARPRRLVLCADALAPADFRRLRARVRWGRWGG